MRHDLLDEFDGFLVGRFVVHEDFADLVREVITQRPHDGVALAIDQERRRALQHDVENRVPYGQQVFEVPGKFLGAAVDACRPQDDAHAVRYFDPGERLSREVAVRTHDAPRHTSGARLVRLQDDKAAGQADVRCKGGTLVAAFFLVDLYDDILAFFQDIANIGLSAGVDVFYEVFAGDFLQRKETVPVGTVVDERGFEARLDARDLTLVDIGFLAFARGSFDIQVKEALAIDHRHAQLFFLSCIDQHSFHIALLVAYLRAANRSGQAGRRSRKPGGLKCGAFRRRARYSNNSCQRDPWGSGHAK